MSRPITPATLERIVLAVAASLGAAGCGIPLDGYDALPCADDGQTTALLSGLTLAEPADYLELRERSSWDTESPWETVDSAGTACTSATDLEACQAALEAATAETGFRLGECLDLCSDSLLVVNRGDAVEVISDPGEVLTLLGSVDTPEEAALVVGLGGYRVSCGEDPGEGGVRAGVDGYEVIATAYTSICAPIIVERYQLGVSSDGTLTELDSEVIGRSSACIGRRPGGLGRACPAGRGLVGAWLGSVATLEAASIQAFDELDAALALHDAPAELRARVARARRDEVRHARQMARLARRHGGEVRAPVVQPAPPRSLEALATENAVEGCVRETYGALVGQWQARTAEDAAIRATMRRVAVDESRHAALSWAIAAWVEPRLDPAARARVDAARAEALAELSREASLPVEASLVHVAGLPSPEAQRALLARLGEVIAAA